MKAIVLFFSITTSLAQTCYFANQNVAINHAPCNVTGSISTCCNKNDTCLSNGLCYLRGSGGLLFAPGSCTDKKDGVVFVMLLSHVVCPCTFLMGLTLN